MHGCPVDVRLHLLKKIMLKSNAKTEMLTGATILPVCPIWRSLGTKPASTAAREAPTAAFSLSASAYSSLKLSPDFRPRPEKVELLLFIFIMCFGYLRRWQQCLELDVVEINHLVGRYLSSFYLWASCLCSHNTLFNMGFKRYQEKKKLCLKWLNKDVFIWKHIALTTRDNVFSAG